MENANSITISAHEVKILKNDITNLGDKISSIERKINQLLGTRVDRICDHDCALCAMVWFCVKKWKLKDVCGRQLEKIILVYALTKGKIDIDNDKEINEIIECSGLIKVLAACQILVLADPQYEFPPKSKERARNNTIDEAWKQLVTIGQCKQYVMLGRIPKAKGENNIRIEELGRSEEPSNTEEPDDSEEPDPHLVGHIEVCNLTGVAGGEIEIYDPQNKEEGLKKDQAGFHEHVQDDAGLQIYTVEWEKIKQIIKWHRKIKSRSKYHYTSNKKSTCEEKECVTINA